MTEEQEKLIEELVAEGMSPDEAAQKAAEIEGEQPPAEHNEEEQDSAEGTDTAEADAEPEADTESNVDETDGADGSEDQSPDGEAVSVEGALKAQNEELAVRLQEALVRLDGRLADPSDLPFDPSFIEDQEALDAAITALVKKKPGLKSKQFGGNIGQGKRGSAAKPKPNLVDILKTL